MSVANSIARGAREADVQAAPVALDIPAEVASRYEVRLVETPNGEQRIGLFGSADRQIPAIEITDDRIVARREDAETIDSLVRIAQHNGWDRIDIAGSPEFRKAVWTAATRQGLEVSGYEPSFAEREELATAGRGKPAPQSPEPAQEAQPISADTGTTVPARSPLPTDKTNPRASAEVVLSEADSRLLLKVSALTADRQALYGGVREDLGTLEREVQYERIDSNRDALNEALERVLDSPTAVKAFERAGYEPEALRASARGGEWDTDVADAIYLVRSGLTRDTLPRETGSRAVLAEKVEAEQKDPAIIASVPPESRTPEPESILIPAEPKQQASAETEFDGAELAELFLRGASDRAAGDPRLAGAMRAQTVMEQHIGEVFDGDAALMASANLESRQLISDALRRGLDVAVREATPVRQIEPVEVRPDLER